MDSNATITITTTSKHDVTVRLHGHKVDITEAQDASFALIASNGAHLTKRKDSDASTDADIIIDEAAPILRNAARNALRSAARDHAGDWKMRAALMKRAGQFARAIR